MLHFFSYKITNIDSITFGDDIYPYDKGYKTITANGIYIQNGQKKVIKK